MEHLILRKHLPHNVPIVQKFDKRCTQQFLHLAFFARQHSRVPPEPENFMLRDKRVCCVLWRRVTCVALRASANALQSRAPRAHQHQQSFRSSQCESFTLCLLTTAGFVGSRKLLSSSSLLASEIAVRMTWSATGADGETKSPSQCHSGRRWDESSWRAHARMAPSCSVQWVLSASGMLAQIRRQGGNNAAHVARSRSLRGARQTECTFSRQDLLSRRKPRARRGSRRLVKTARELQDAELEAKTKAACLRAPRNQTTRHAQLACRWTARWLDTDGSRLRSFAIHQALATAQDKIAAHPNPARRSCTKGRDGPHCSGHGAAETPTTWRHSSFPPNLAALLGCVRAGQNETWQWTHQLAPSGSPSSSLD